MGRFLFIIFLFLAGTAQAFTHADAVRRREVSVLFVRGFEPAPGRLAPDEDRGDWEAVAAVFERAGFHSRLSRSTTGGSIEESSAIIAAEIADSPLPVIAVGHSLGGPKILDALLRSRRAAENTAGLLLVQCPNHGAHACKLALNLLEPDRPLMTLHDAALDTLRDAQQSVMKLWDPFSLRRLNPLWTTAEDVWYVAGKTAAKAYRSGRGANTRFWLEFLWGGNSQVLDELLPEARANYLDTHSARIRQFATMFPIVSVVGHGSMSDSKLKRLLEHAGLESDGVIELESQNFGLGTSLHFDTGHTAMVYRPHHHLDEWASCIRAIVEAGN